MIVPIFPLPNVVFFPKTLLPLHIFEERYRMMTREALSGDRRIALVLLREGWQASYNASPAVHEIACLGRIEKSEELKNGKFNIVLSGLCRVRLMREVQQRPYRTAEVLLLREEPCDDNAMEIIRLRNHIAGLFTRYMELQSEGEARAPELVPQLKFETLVNTVASTLNFPPEQKQSLLELDDARTRCAALIPLVQRQVEALMLVRSFAFLKPSDPSRN